MILICPLCHRAVALLVDGLCLACEAEHGGHEVYRADCEACASELAAYLA